MSPAATTTKDRLLKAAFEEFSRRGFAGARVDEIASRAGANKALIYQYYGDKEALFKHVLEQKMNEMGQISGQRPSIRRARKSISNFKLREGVPIGCAVTLRGARMYEFYDRLINVAVPRIRDFRGLNQRSFDGQGNYSMGLTEQIIFPEINYDKVGKIRGMDVTIVTSAKTDEEGRELLRLMSMPFRQR